MEIKTKHWSSQWSPECFTSITCSDPSASELDVLSRLKGSQENNNMPYTENLCMALNGHIQVGIISFDFI